VVLLLSYSWMPSKISTPNERSRAYLAVSLAEDETIRIDEEIRRYGKILDVSYFQGHKYTDKAPGSSFFGAVLYKASKFAGGEREWKIEEIVNLMRTWLMIPFGLAGFVLLRRLLHLFRMRQSAVDMTSLSWILGSAAFHYSTAFYGHQIVAVLFLVIIYLDRMLEEERATSRRILYFAVMGLSAGVAGITEFQSGIFCAALAVYVVVRNRRSLAQTVPFFAGAAVFVALLLYYNWSAFGGPFELSYHHLSKSMQQRHGFGIAGVGLPQLDALVGILFSLHRGIFSMSPLFLLSIPGLVMMWRSGRGSLCLLIGFTMIGYLVYVSGAEIWHGGWAFGPRLFVPALGLACVPVAFTVEFLSRKAYGAPAVVGLSISGMLYYQISHLVFQELPTHCTNPMVDVILPSIIRGVFSPNLFSKYLDVEGYLSIAPAVAVVVAVLVWMIAANVGWKKGLRNVGLSVALIALPTLVVFSTASISGPSWKEKKTKAFVGWIENESGLETR